MTGLWVLIFVGLVLAIAMVGYAFTAMLSFAGWAEGIAILLLAGAGYCLTLHFLNAAIARRRGGGR